MNESCRWLFTFSLFHLFTFSLSLNVAACLAALFEVALVVFLGAPESLRRLDPGDDAFRLESAFGGELLDLGPGLLLLLGGMEEDSGPVLGAPIGSLAVERGGIVQREERIEDVLVAHLLGIEIQLDHLGMP